MGSLKNVKKSTDTVKFKQISSTKKVQSLTFHNLHPNCVKYHLERCLANVIALKVLIHPFHRSILFAKRFVAFKKVKVSTLNLTRPSHFFQTMLADLE